ncbi:alpha-isopropylmalate synthase regulatory domain-containing protein [Lentisphaerota bacterium WC36G]|nr:2-isopropylmalate synthase [Lentisphaerae bacterium WC36]
MVKPYKYDRNVEIMDTTLRDGEQTPAVAYTPEEKLQLAKILLQKLKVDRIEVGSARVSEGEHVGAKNIIEWAASQGMADKVELLGFVDKGKSVDWICAAGGKVINLLTKGSEKHCRIQLGKTPEEHYKEVCEQIDYANSRGLIVNVYLEDWSSGMRDSFQYVFAFVKELEKHNVARVMLPDTLGILTPAEMTRYLEWMITASSKLKYEFHGHNDYGLVTANSLAAVEAGIYGIHTTLNGLGERTGNQTLCEIVACIHDMTDRTINIVEEEIHYTANVVEAITGKKIAANSPIVGSDVFTQTCGVHADGDKKGNLYANDLLPERFSRKRIYALGKTSGKASIDKNLEELGLDLPKDVRDAILSEVIRLGDKKKNITPDDLPFIIAKIVRSPKYSQIKIVDYSVTTKKGESPCASVEIDFNGKILTASASGDGGYDAFVQAVRIAMEEINVTTPSLKDYEVRIPPGGMTDALVETMITWESDVANNQYFNNNDSMLITIGVDSDQMVAAIEATEKMLNHVVSQIDNK